MKDLTPKDVACSIIYNAPKGPNYAANCAVSLFDYCKHLESRLAELERKPTTTDLGKDLAELGKRTVDALEELHRRVDELEPASARKSGLSDQSPPEVYGYTDAEIDAIKRKERDDAMEEAARACDAEAIKASSVGETRSESELRYMARAIRALKSTKQ